MSSNQYLEIRERLTSLSESMLRSVDRPYWQVELIDIVLCLADLFDCFYDGSCDYSALKSRIDSIEIRYSELLYRMSQRS